MPQYRKDLFNLAPGPGEAIPDPAEDERLRRQVLALQQQQQALQQGNSMRDLRLRETELQQRAAQAAQELQLRAMDAAQSRALQERLGAQQFEGFERERASRERIAEGEAATRRLLAARGEIAADRRLQAELMDRFQGRQLGQAQLAEQRAGREFGQGLAREAADLDLLKFYDPRGAAEAEKDRALQRELMGMQVGQRGAKESREEKLLVDELAAQFMRLPEIESGRIGSIDFRFQLDQLKARNPAAYDQVVQILQSPGFAARLRKGYAIGGPEDNILDQVGKGLRQVLGTPFGGGLFGVPDYVRAKELLESLGSARAPSSLDRAQTAAGIGTVGGPLGGAQNPLQFFLGPQDNYSGGNYRLRELTDLERRAQEERVRADFFTSARHR